ncbi:hypothetical protein VRK_27180 [Vibrio sp. MEBiC08052]|nr:hypothetical protein VRK_27180 [Vibrio sp. MEBiC08052]
MISNSTHLRKVKRVIIYPLSIFLHTYINVQEQHMMLAIYPDLT